MAPKFQVLVGDRVLFSAGSIAALVRQLAAEQEGWGQIFSGLRLQPDGSRRVFAGQYSNLIAKVEATSTDAFQTNGVQISGDSRCTVFPALGSLDGRLVQVLQTNKRLQGGVIAAFWIENGWENRNIFHEGSDFASDANVGRAILAVARAQVLLKLPDDKQFDIRRERLDREILELETRAEDFRKLLVAKHAELARSSGVAMSKLDQLQRLGTMFARRTARRMVRKEDKWDEQFKTTHDAYVAKLQFEAPATLWTNSATRHRAKSKSAFAIFLGISGLSGATALVATMVWGDSLAKLFVEQKCLFFSPICTTNLSVKGPLTTGAVLLVTSMIIWVLRMMNRIHLSERNLAQSAEEKKAFVETYLALIKDGKVTRDQEAIVLGAIFRPSADGYVSDDGSSMDISAAAVLAKVMSGGR